jgi:hypothetical protein
MGERLKWYDEDGSSPWIDALAELRRQATREATVLNTCSESRSRSTNTPRRRCATANTFSTSLTASVSFAASEGRWQTLSLPPARTRRVQSCPYQSKRFVHSIGCTEGQSGNIDYFNGF